MKKILTGLLLLIGFAVHAQYPSNYTPLVKSYGNGYTRIWADSVLHLPLKKALTLNDGSTMPQIFVKGTSLYFTDSAGNFYTVSGGAAGITALTGDGTASGSGSVPFTLATVNANLFGANTLLAQTLDGKGRALSARAANNSDITGALGFVPVNNSITITINGVTQDLTLNRSWSIAATSTDNLDSVLSRGGTLSNDRFINSGNHNLFIDSCATCYMQAIGADGLSNVTVNDTLAQLYVQNTSGSKIAAMTVTPSQFIFVDQSTSTKPAGAFMVLLDPSQGIADWSTSAPLSSTLTSGKIWIGNVSNVATAQTPSGDWTINNAGLATISNNVVGFSKFQQLSANKLTGNSTGSTANMQQIGLGNFMQFVSGNLADTAIHLSDFTNDIGLGGGGSITNIGTGFPLGVAGTNNIKKLSCNGCYFDSTSIANTLTLSVPNVFNVRNFCGYCTTGKYPGDGKMIAANMTSGSAIVTATASVFVATDTGKIIKIDSAGIGNFDLVDTIVTVTDATHVTVHKNASHSVTTSTTCFGTDASGAIQGATNAATTAKGGTVWFPNGIYPTNDSVKTSIDGHNPNSQFYVHMITSSVSPYISPIDITWEGEQAPELDQSTPISSNPQPMNGAVVYSWAKQTSKSYTSVLATGEDSAFVFNSVEMRVHNMEFMVCENIIPGGAAIGGINFGNFIGQEWNNLLITTDQPAINSVAPTNPVFGINTTQTSGGSFNIGRNSLIIGMPTAYVFGEHFDGDGLQAMACTNALSPTFADHASKIGRIGVYWCVNAINPNVPYGGLAVLGTHTLEIFQLAMEVDTSSSHWWKYSKTVNDPNNYIHGFAYYKMLLRATHGYSSFLSSVNGAANFNLDSAENPVMHNRDNYFTGTTSRYLALNVTNTSSGQAAFLLQSNGVTKWQMGMDAAANGNNNFYIFDQAHSLNRVLIDSSGNVNIGGNASTSPLFTLPLTGASTLNPHLYPAGSYSLGVSSFGIQAVSATTVLLANNAILNSAGSAFLYDTVGAAAWLQLQSGSIVGRTAPSGGGAGSPISAFVTSFSFNQDKSGGIGGAGTATGSTGYWFNWTTTGNFTPAANNTQDFGASATRWATMFGVTGNFTALKTGYVSTAISRTLLITDHSVEVTATGTTQTLPTAVGAQGQHYRIKLTATGSCTIATTSSQTIDGSTTYTLSAQNKYVELESNNVSWLIFANN